MDETLAQVYLNCLKCGAKLRITNNIYEFACQYCGTPQIVGRAGGIVVLKFLSDKIDHVQISVDKNTALLTIRKLTNELQELEERHTKLDEATVQMKRIINPLAITLMGAVFFGFFVAAAFTNSIIPLLFGGIVTFIIFFLWRKKIDGIDADFERGAKPMIKKGIEIKKKIAELEKILEY